MSLFEFDDDNAEYYDEYSEEGTESEIGAQLDAKMKRSFRIERNEGFELEDFGMPTADSNFATKYHEDTRDAYEYHRKKELSKLIHKYYIESEIGKLLLGKEETKIPSHYYSEIYIAIRSNFLNVGHSESDIFVAICEYFCFPSYDIFYTSIPLIYKEALLKEMDEKYGMLKKRGKNKLF